MYVSLSRHIYRSLFMSVTAKCYRRTRLQRMLQCVAVYCSVLQCVAVCCSVWQCIAVCCSVLQRRTRLERITLRLLAAGLFACLFLCGHIAAHCNTLQHTATHCNTLQHTATHCNTLQQMHNSQVLPTHATPADHPLRLLAAGLFSRPCDHFYVCRPFRAYL